MMKEYYLQRASAGLIITEATGISVQGALLSVILSVLYVWCLLSGSRCHHAPPSKPSPTLASSLSGFGWHNAPGIYDEKMCAAWKDIVDAVHEKGSKIYLQLWHMGRQVCACALRSFKPPIDSFSSVFCYP
jgi:2,4-dienoyl-CoA reductase-like NADH-dependent reductase (Old Yellow Enzyme family)